MKKTLFVIASLLIGLSIALVTATAEERATPEEVYQKVVDAAIMIESLGEDGLKALSNTKEFVWKDSYVWAVDCEKGVCVAHPNEKYIGLELNKVWDKNKDESKRKLFNLELCEGSKNPFGVWVEYYWERLGYDEPQRKISFMINVPNQPYQVTAGIYDDETSVQELMQLLK